MLKSYQEDEIYWLLKNFADKVKEVNNDDELAKDYAHRVSILLENNCNGDVMLFEEFIRYVKHGYFTDYDGSGAFVDNITGKEIKDLRCDVKWLKKHKPENSDYIIWFNK